MPRRAAAIGVLALVAGGMAALPIPQAHASGGASNWAQLAVSGPPGGPGAAIAYDQATSTDVLFTTGGQTWSFDGSAWTQLAPASSPSPRSYAAMAYDQANGTVVLFGGQSGSTYLSDTWVWNGTDWSERAAGTTDPPARAGASATYSSFGSGTVLLFGGYDGATYLADTWFWNGTSWSELEASFVGSGAGPSPRADAMMADDGSDGSIVLYGGQGPTGRLGDTWVFGATNWTLASTSGPAARSGGAAAYSPEAGKVLLFGGASGSYYDADTWLWGGSGWSEEDGASAPPARTGAAMASDPAGGVVLFGGEGTTGPLGDTWAWLPPAPPQPASASRIGAGPFHTSGNQIIGPDGKPVIFKGVNAFTFGTWQDGTADMPDPATMVQQAGLMRAWGFNLVRIFIFDNMWLNPTCTTPNYQTDVQDAVDAITSDGMVAEISLWGAEDQGAGTPCADLNHYWPDMADYPYSLTMWQQVAQMFKGNPAVVFETFNEPHIAEETPPGYSEDDVWLNGDNNPPAGFTPPDGAPTAGMQQIYDAIRSTGATNLVFVTGETLGPGSGQDVPANYTGPYDSIKVALRTPVQGYNIVYATHIYIDGGCGPEFVNSGVSSVDANDPSNDDVYNSIVPVAGKYPVVIDEFGTACGTQGSAEEYIANIVNFADDYQLGYAVFAWSRWYDPGYGIYSSAPDYSPVIQGLPVFYDLRDQLPSCTLYGYSSTPDYLGCPGTFPQASGLPLTSASEASVSISPTDAAGASGLDYAVDFTTSDAGALTSASWVRVEAPAGTSFYDVADPVVVDLSSGQQVSASCCVQVGEESYDYSNQNYTLSAASNVITIPLSGTVAPGDRVQVQLDGVANPPSGLLSLQVSTSTDRAPAATNALALSPARSVSAVSESLSSSTAGATGVTWTTTFTTSSTGAMSGSWPGGQVTITAPAGTDFSGSGRNASLYDITTATKIAGLAYSYPAGSLTFALQDPVSAGDTLQLVVGNVTNPPAGTYTVSVATSSDTAGTSGALTLSRRRGRSPSRGAEAGGDRRSDLRAQAEVVQP